MSDITTVEEVQAEDYRVRVAQTDDGTAWEAVVLSEDSGDSGSPHGMDGMFTLGQHPPAASEDNDTETPIGPPVTAPHRWVAIGFAIEAYEFEDNSEYPKDTTIVYGESEITDAELSLEDSGIERVLPSEKRESTCTATMDLGEFPGPWSPDGGDGDE